MLLVVPDPDVAAPTDPDALPLAGGVLLPPAQPEALPVAVGVLLPLAESDVLPPDVPGAAVWALPPGVTDEAAIAALVEKAGVPLNVLFVPGLSLDRLAALGVRRVSTGSLLFRAALTAAVEAAAAVAAGGAPAKGLVSYAEVQALNEPPAGARTTGM